MISNQAPPPHTDQPFSSKALGRVNPIVDKSGRFNKLQQSFQKQLLALAHEFYRTYQKPLVLTDTVRTQEEQARAHQEKPALALPAGHPNAMHPKGLAADVDSSQSRMITPAMLAKAGLHLPALDKGETWHLEPVCPTGSISSFRYCSSSRTRSLNSADLATRITAAKSTSQTRPPERLGFLKQQGLTERTSPSERGLVQAAVEIESIFVEQLLGQMRGAMVDPLSTSPKKLRGYLQMADQQLARSLAASGGLGLAQRIVEDLASLNSRPQTENRRDGNVPIPGAATPDQVV